jgi:hypothetical protein
VQYQTTLVVQWLLTEAIGAGKTLTEPLHIPPVHLQQQVFTAT